jgi:hypothetical protein
LPRPMILGPSRQSKVASFCNSMIKFFVLDGLLR